MAAPKESTDESDELKVKCANVGDEVDECRIKDMTYTKRKLITIQVSYA